MGNFVTFANKIKEFLAYVQSGQQLTYFQIQQNTVYSNEIGRKCLEHMINVSDFVYLETLKKIHKYLHPALKYIQYCHYLSSSGHQNEQNQNFIRIHQQELISSATNILQMYCVYLSRIVPANISYFHFMREKDFYIHYNALKYVLQIWKISSIFGSTARSFDVFSRLSIQNRLLYIKFISHWLYDMVKYKCSAIYLQSNTLPYLIVINAVVLCRLLDYDKVNLLEEYQRKQKNDTTKSAIYQHTLYAFTFILSQCHFDKRNGSSQGNGYIQVVLLGISKLIHMMWKDYDKMQLKTTRKKTMYAPSYWYVESIEYIQNPQLENIIFRLIIDMIAKKNIDLWQNLDNKLKVNLKQLIDEQLPEKNYEKYYHFEDEIQGHISKPEIRENRKSQRANNQNSEIKTKTNQQFEDPQLIFQSQSKIKSDKMMKVSSHTKNQIFHCYSPINNLTQLIFYHSLIGILQCFPQFIEIKQLQKTLQVQIKTLSPHSFIRPYILEIIHQIKSSRTNVQENLQEYYNNNKMDYSTQSYIIPYVTVGRNCSIFLNNIFPNTMKSYYKQIQLSDGEIWRQILKYNIHEFKEKLK